MITGSPSDRHRGDRRLAGRLPPLSQLIEPTRPANRFVAPRFECAVLTLIVIGQEEDSLTRRNQATKAGPASTLQADGTEFREWLSQSCGQCLVIEIGRIDIHDHTTFGATIRVRLDPRQAVSTHDDQRHARRFLAGVHAVNVASLPTE